MNMKGFVVLLAVSLMAGCSATLRLYPVQGPLSAQTPPPVFTGKVTGVITRDDILHFITIHTELETNGTEK